MSRYIGDLYCVKFIHLFFFFKQKTAYEMRISDWSSDVCSSDLVGYTDPRIRAWMIAGLVMGHAQAMTGQTIGFLVIDRLHVAPEDALQPTGLVLMMGAGAALLAQWGSTPLPNLSPRKDRKSVVQDTRVSVRLELGGSRTLKKTSNT